MSVEPQWEACKVCGGDHWTNDHEAQRLADWMLDNLPRVHRWMTVGWRETMRDDEAVVLMREAIAHARLSR